MQAAEASTAPPLQPLTASDIFRSVERLSAIALAVSGGSDSKALLCLAEEWKRERSHPALHVLTVDHRLRPEAAQEAEQVAVWCSRHGLPHATLVWREAKGGQGLQARARAARYDLMTDWCAAHGVTHLLTAHTLDDQAETVLMRQQRTNSAASLAGVWRERAWQGVTLVRPLLDVRREELRRYLRERGESWVEDPSNENPAFERVRVRRLLSGQDAGVSEALARTAHDAAEKASRLSNFADAWIAAPALWREGYAALSRASFEALNAEESQYVLRALIWALGGLSVAPDEVERLRLWLYASGPGRRTLGGCLFVKKQAEMLVGREAGRIPAAPVTVPPSGKVLWDNRFWITAEPGCRIVSAAAAGRTGGPEGVPAFVRAGWPVILEPEAGAEGLSIEFRPRLR